MPLDRFVLIIVCVIAAVIATFAVTALIGTLIGFPIAGWLLAIPAALAGYIAWRVISERLSSAEDDHYDRIEK